MSYLLQILEVLILNYDADQLGIFINCTLKLKLGLATLKMQC